MSAPASRFCYFADQNIVCHSVWDYRFNHIPLQRAKVRWNHRGEEDPAGHFTYSTAPENRFPDFAHGHRMEWAPYGGPTDAVDGALTRDDDRSARRRWRGSVESRAGDFAADSVESRTAEASTSSRSPTGSFSQLPPTPPQPLFSSVDVANAFGLPAIEEDSLFGFNFDHAADYLKSDPLAGLSTAQFDFMGNFDSTPLTSAVRQMKSR